MPTRNRTYLRSARRLAVLGATSIALLVPAGSASAGGPTSVLIVSPQTGQTASLYATDRDYELLTQALGENPKPDGHSPLSTAGPGVTDVNITWLVHDVAVWRIDEIVRTFDRGLWVQTRIGLVDGPIDLGQRGVWHRPAEPELLLEVLTRLRVLDEKATAAHSGDSAVSEPKPAAVSITESGASAWWWIVPGLIVGVLLGTLARPAGSRLAELRRRQWRRGPRQELMDLQ